MGAAHDVCAQRMLENLSCPGDRQAGHELHGTRRLVAGNPRTAECAELVTSDVSPRSAHSKRMSPFAK